MPLVPACTCTDPNVCPHRHQTYSAIYSHGPPSGRWAPDYSSQYSYPYFPPWVAPAAPSLNTHDFIPYQPPPAPSPSDQPAFRVALGETTSQSVNVGQSMSAGNKRKRTNTGSSNARNPRRATSTSNSNTLPNTSLSSTPTSNNQNIPPVPAVHGVGPTTSTAFSGPSLPHPAFQLQLGRSIIEKGKNSSGKTTGASDVWYFVRGLHSNIRPATLPETESLSEKQPDPSNFMHLGCRLCE